MFHLNWNKGGNYCVSLGFFFSFSPVVTPFFGSSSAYLGKVLIFPCTCCATIQDKEFLLYVE